jgi:2-polyprenyl-3-methyl-5-hydroxy-6-metoxy-1,4-benzoquinol methylase
MKDLFGKLKEQSGENPPENQIAAGYLARQPAPANDERDNENLDHDYITKTLDEYFERRNDLLKDIDQTEIKKAWFTMSHLLLPEGAKVVDMGCRGGMLLYVMAVLNPNLRFIGVDKSKRNINKAKELYQVHNLEFIQGDITSDIFPEGSVDAIIDSYVLHHVYSDSRYNSKIIADTMACHFKMLKPGGLIFIRDYARPAAEDYVWIEMHDKPSVGMSLDKLSDTDLLIWYAEHAKPSKETGISGFFLEELPPRFPKTRLFRLPYKWAYEFIMRKDNRKKWEKKLPVEYTFFTPHEFRKELRSLGARVNYSGPYWDEDYIEENFEGRFRLYKDNGSPIGHPPTCFIAVAQKLPERRSLRIEERRPSDKTNSSLKVTAMRNDQTGQIVDVVSRTFRPSEIIPYHVNEEGRLKIYLHDGVARGIANSVPRNGFNIDSKIWSGHMIEALAVDSNTILEMGTFDVKNTVRFARDYLALKPRNNAILVHGPDYYPAPDYIDERIYTYYIDVERSKKPVTPKNLHAIHGKFQAQGEIREFDAQQILNAITVGMIPNARLELQILSLYEKLGLKAETWTSRELRVQKQKVQLKKELPDILKQIAEQDSRFKEVKGSAGDLRTVNSVFIEEGVTQGSETGLSAENLDFIVSDTKTINTAIVIPLSKGMKDEIYAGFTTEYLPVPQRHEGSGMTIRAPSFNIPKEITNIKQLKQFVADQFGVPPEMVLKLGESYFNHVGVTAHRIYPFAVTAPMSMFSATDTKFIPIHQYRLLWFSLSRSPHFMTVIARAWQYLHTDIKQDFKTKVSQLVKERFEGRAPDWSIPVSYVEPPGKKPIKIQKELAMQLANEADGKIPQEPGKTPLDFNTASPQHNLPLAEPINPLSAQQATARLQSSASPLAFHQAVIDSSQPDNGKIESAESAAIDEIQDLEDLVEAIEKTMPHEPRPEKW